jgi:hypothetical protein
MDHVNEEWRAVLGFEGYYEASSLGRVRSVDRTIVRSDGKTKRFRGRLMMQQLGSQRRYMTVRLKRDGGGRTLLVHRLVLEAFVGRVLKAWSVATRMMSPMTIGWRTCAGIRSRLTPKIRLPTARITI